MYLVKKLLRAESKKADFYLMKATPFRRFFTEEQLPTDPDFDPTH